MTCQGKGNNNNNKLEIYGGNETFHPVTGNPVSRSNFKLVIGADRGAGLLKIIVIIIFMLFLLVSGAFVSCRDDGWHPKEYDNAPHSLSEWGIKRDVMEKGHKRLDDSSDIPRKAMFLLHSIYEDAIIRWDKMGSVPGKLNGPTQNPGNTWILCFKMIITLVLKW